VAHFTRNVAPQEIKRGVDSERLVFVDEMGTHASLAPLYAYVRP
jgi:hypothetical protein